MKRFEVKSLKIGEEIEDVFKVIGCEPMTYSNSGTTKTRLNLVLQDHSGQVDAIRWDVTEQEINEARRIEYACVRGKVGDYKGKRQIKLSDPLEAVSCPDDTSDYERIRTEPLAQMQARLSEHIASIQHPGLKKLLTAIFGDAAIQQSFEQFPAAERAHHAYRHGLMQHTLEVADCAVALAEISAQWRDSDVSRDLTLAGALLHDIGKLQELDGQQEVCTMTRHGMLLGHTALGYVRIASKIAKIIEIEPETRDALLHILLSHHGKREHGAPVTPMFPEAIIVHMADDLSAKLCIIREAQQEAAGTDFVKTGLLEGKSIYVGRRIGTAPPPLTMSKEEPAVTPAAPAYLPLPVFRLLSAPDAERHPPLSFETRRVAFYGKVAAGFPQSTSEEPIESFSIESQGLNPADQFFLVEVDGESMTGDGLNPGDKVLVRKQSKAEHNDIVIAWFDDNRASIKHFRQAQDGAIMLVSSNPAFPPLPVPDPQCLQIHGKVIGAVQAIDQ